MDFRFLPLRFDFVARDQIVFPAGKAGNTLRGALGVVLGRSPEAYGQVFRPLDGGPSGLGDPPRPFVFRARHLDGCTIPAEQTFHFDVHLFSLDSGILPAFIDSFRAFAAEGIGPRRGKAELLGVRRLAFGKLREERVGLAMPAPVTLDLNPVSPAPRSIRVDFLSPTELKAGREVAAKPEFPILFARIRDRISTLRSLYGSGPLEMDFQAAGARARAVQMTRCEVRLVEVLRRSTRTGQTHAIGGFVGFAEYQGQCEGQMDEFVPFLEAARWIGVGRQAVWGKGEISVGHIIG